MTPRRAGADARPDTGPGAGSGAAAPSGEPPVLRVVRGDATDEELAALVTALAAARRSAPAPQPAPSRWADRAAQIGAALAPGPGAWLAGAWHHRPRHR